MDRYHRSTPDHVFGEATVVGISAAKSDHDYNYKNDFEILRENQEFERQFFFDESTTFRFDSYLYKIDKRKNITFGLNYCWYENTRPQAKTRSTESSKRKRKEHVP